jgi:hypothetical protein
MSVDSKIDDEIEKIKNEFYSSTGKNVFFKNSQKFECAKQITNQIPFDQLLTSTCRILHEHKVVYVDYVILKSYASPEIYNNITEDIVQVFKLFVSQYGFLSVALNLDTFTVSAAHRYKDIIVNFCDKCFKYDTGFSLVLTKFAIYNIPITFDTIIPILLPFILDEVKPKISLVKKPESMPVFREYGLI